MTGLNQLTCVFCHRQEKFHHKGKIIPYPLDEGYDTLICSICFQKLIMVPEAKVIKAYKLALELGYLEKAAALESFIPPQEVLRHDGKTQKVGRNHQRTEPLRLVRPRRRLERSKPSAFGMGQSRAAVS